MNAVRPPITHMAIRRDKTYRQTKGTEHHVTIRGTPKRNAEKNIKFALQNDLNAVGTTFSFSIKSVKKPTEGLRSNTTPTKVATQNASNTWATPQKI